MCELLVLSEVLNDANLALGDALDATAAAIAHSFAGGRGSGRCDDDDDEDEVEPEQEQGKEEEGGGGGEEEEGGVRKGGDGGAREVGEAGRGLGDSQSSQKGCGDTTETEGKIFCIPLFAFPTP